MFYKSVENIRLAIDALTGNKLRSALTMLGITIGVASVILLMSVGQAVERFVIGEFSNFGSNLVFVFGKADNQVEDQFNASDAEIFEPLTEDDLNALNNPFNVTDAAVIAAAVAVTDPLIVDGESYTPQIAGITPNYTEAYDFDIGIGEPITWDHVDSAARVAVVGVDVVEEVFNNEYVIGKQIRIGDVNFEIIGVWEEIESAIDPNANNVVVLPLTTVQRRLIAERTTDGGYPISSISVKARDAAVVDSLVEQVRTTLRDVRDLDPDEKDDFVILSQNDLLDSLDTITSLLTTFLAVIAGISLLVGGIGIMNIMLVTVTERTREIGIRKAVGAQRTDILTQFLIEAVTLSLVGGTIGTFIAISLSLLVSSLVPNLNVEVQASSILMATFISLGVGTFFGAYPANRAATLNPIDALHYE